MSKRSYNQFCPLAVGLDIIGDRWTILIVRELSLGPRRFTDIQHALPGIGLNLLSQRLKDLEEYQVIHRAAASGENKNRGYTLTDGGRDLQRQLEGFAVWGIRYMPMPPPDDFSYSNVATIIALQFMFQEQTTANWSVEIHLESDVFRVMIEDGQLILEQGIAIAPDLIFSTDAQTFLMSVPFPMQIPIWVDEGKISIEQGTTDLLQQFFSCFSLPEGIGTAVQ